MKNENLNLTAAVKADNLDRVIGLLRLHADIEQIDPNPTTLNFFEHSPVYNATPLFLSMTRNGKKATSIMLELLRVGAKYNRTVSWNPEDPKHLPICNSEIFDHIEADKRALIHLAKAEDALRDITAIADELQNKSEQPELPFAITPKELQQLYQTPQNEIDLAYASDKKLVVDYLSGLERNLSVRNLIPKQITVMKTIVAEVIEKRVNEESWVPYCNLL